MTKDEQEALRERLRKADELKRDIENHQRLTAVVMDATGFQLAPASNGDGQVLWMLNKNNGNFQGFGCTPQLPYVDIARKAIADVLSSAAMVMEKELSEL